MNVLIIGLGSIARKHIQALRAIDRDVTIYALRHSQSGNVTENVIDVYSISELKGIDLDFAIVSNPTSEHKKTIKSLLPLKCPLFIEKPLYFDLDIAELVEEVEKQGALTYVACNLRFLDCLNFVKQAMDKSGKRVNEVNVYCGSSLPGWREGDFRESYSAIPALGGGVHLDLIHEFDYLYWIFGTPSHVQSCLKSHSSLDIEAFDYANYCLDYGTFCAGVILNYYRRDYKRTFELLFDDYTWVVDLSSNEIKCDGELIFESKQKMTDTYLPQMKYFVNLISSHKGRSNNTISDAYNVLKICLANDTKR